MKKNEIYEGTVAELRFPNKGVVCTAEENVIVKGVLPGQTVSFVLTKKKNGRYEGRLQEVLKKAPMEMDSPCPHFGDCGGCSYQNLPYTEELKLKSSQVKTILDRAIRGEYVYEGITASPESEEYRNKMEFSFGNEYLDGPLTLGMHRAGRFNDVITVDKCRIMDGDYRVIIRRTLDFFREKGIPFYRKHTEEGFLRHLLLRKGKKTGEILLLIETTTQLDFDMGRYAEMLLSLQNGEKDGEDKLKGTFAGILHLKNDSTGDCVKGDNIDILYGRDHFYDEVLGLRFRITPFSFFQTNTKGAELLYGKAREYALSVADEGKKPVIFDLYSGTGTIGQIMSETASKVIGIEIVDEAVKAAGENAELNGLQNTEFLSGDVLKKLEETEERPDLIILDPPRDGCAPKALEKILAYDVENMIYISCKITSLERDLTPIQEAGYHVVKAAAVDMFPNTSGVETIVLLSKEAAAGTGDRQ
ncbi:MAG: 23S rRNA (uracil(1939)-C(5))-methyltransferase RlmD [Lachnospiraceae bacterium]|nr:23S rRNA (uracil(1939)-C(5))-methyltransferase RlmD [Lachnospiraceae bacterium]